MHPMVLVIAGFAFYMIIMRWLFGRRRANVNVCIALLLCGSAARAQVAIESASTRTVVITSGALGEWLPTYNHAVDTSLWRASVATNPANASTKVYDGWMTNIVPPTYWQTHSSSLTLELSNFGSYLSGSVPVYRSVTTIPGGTATAYGSWCTPGVVGELCIWAPADMSYVTIWITAPGPGAFPERTLYPEPSGWRSLFPAGSVKYSMSAPVTSGGWYDSEFFGGAHNTSGIVVEGLPPVRTGIVPTSMPSGGDEKTIFNAIADNMDKVEQSDSIPDYLVADDLLTPCYTAMQMRGKIVNGINQLPGVSIEAQIFGSRGITWDVFLTDLAVSLDSTQARFAGLLGVLRLAGDVVLGSSCLMFLLKMWWWAIGARGFDQSAPPVLSPG